MTRHVPTSSKPPLDARKNFSIVSCIVVAEPISSTVLLPFVYFMVQGFGYGSSEIGPRAGLITSAFFVAQMFSNPLWSLLSNRIGRKACLILGLLGTAVSMLAFGVSQNLAWAIISRSVCGLMNGNNPIARTVVGELSDITGVDKAKAFSLFGFCLSAGWMIGPLVGGSLADPAIHLGFSGPGNIFATFPWLFPCMFIAGYNLTVATLAFFFMDDISMAEVEDADQPQDGSPDETDALLPPSEPEIATPLEKDINIRKAQGLTLFTTLFYFIHIICFDELLPLFAASSLELGVGLSFTPQQIAQALLFAGPAMFASLLGFATLHRRFGSVRLWRVTAVIFTAIYPIFSALPWIAARTDVNVVLWVILPPLIVVRYASMVISLASVQILFNDLCRPSERAFINGLGQSVGSLARAIGPTLGGMCWSWSVSNGLSAPMDYHFTFLLLSALGVAQHVSTWGIPSDEALDRLKSSGNLRARSTA